MPNISIRQELVNGLVTQLQTISQTNGYLTDIASVVKFRQSGRSLANLPQLLVGFDRETKDIGLNNQYSNFLNLDVTAELIHYDATTDPRSTFEELDDIVSDIERCIHASSWYRDIGADDMEVTGIFPGPLMDGGDVATVQVQIQVKYRNKIGHPDTYV